jgi:hypothetical protein
MHANLACSLAGDTPQFCLHRGCARAASVVMSFVSTFRIRPLFINPGVDYAGATAHFCVLQTDQCAGPAIVSVLHSGLSLI